MAQLDPQRRLIVDELRRRFEEMQYGAVPDRPTFVLLRATPGVGKTRIVQELYEALRLEQSVPPFWPSLFSEDVEHSVLKERHLIGPKVGSHFKDHEPSAQMDYLWWGIHCENTTSDPLVAAVDDIRFLAPALLEVESRRGRKVLNASGDLTDAASSALGIVSFAGLAAPAAATLLLAIPTPATIVAGAAAALSFTRKYVEWREKKREEEQQRNIHDSANSANSVEGLAGNLAGLSQDLPIVLVVNDAHFASERVVALLAELNQRRARILVVLTSWPVADETRPFPSWWGDNGGEEIYLDDLGLETLQSLFDETLEGVVPEVRNAVIARMDHNPLTLRVALQGRGFRAKLLEARTTKDVDLIAVPRNPDKAFKMFWDELPEDVTTALALASHLGATYFDKIIIDAVSQYGPLIDGLWDALAAQAGLQAGASSGVVRKEIDNTLHRFIETTFYELADDVAQRSGQISDDDTRAIRDQLQRFLREEHPQLNSKVLQVLRTRLIELASDYDDIDVELALSGAITTVIALSSNGADLEALRVATLATELSQKHQLENSELGLASRSWRSRSLSVLGHHEEAFALAEEVLTAYRAFFRPDHPYVLWAMGHLANTYRDLGRYTEALSLQREVLTAYRAIFPAGDTKVLGAKGSLANTYLDLADYEDARVLSEEVLAAFCEMFPPDHPKVLWAMGILASSHSGLGRYDEALFLEEKVLAARRAAFPPDHPDVLWAMGSLANICSNLGRNEVARALQEEVLAAFRAVFPGNHRNVLAVLGNLANTYSNLGCYDDARALQEEVLSAYRELFSADHPDVLRAMGNLANTYSDLGRYAEARAFQEEVLTAYRELFPADHPYVFSVMGNLANSHSGLGRYDDARALQEEVLSAYRELFSPDHPDVLWIMGNLAVTYSNLGQHNDALALQEEVLATYLEEFPSDHHYVLTAKGNLAISYSNLGRYDDARGLKEEVLAARRDAFPPNHPDVLTAMGNLANTYSTLGRYDEARSLHEGVLAAYRDVFPADDRYLLLAMGNLAATYSDLGRYDEARELQEEVLTAYRDAFPPNHHDVLQAMGNLAITSSALGRHEYAQVLRDEIDRLGL